MTKEDAKRAITEWMSEEYDEDVREITDADERIAFAYTEYEGQGDDLFVMEQWRADLNSMTFFCEMNEERVPELDIKFGSFDEMVDSLDFDWLIGEADEYIREHREQFEEV